MLFECCFLPADGEEAWYPREKIQSARKKLQGHNPAHVMLLDLEKGHGKTREFTALKNILMGDRKVHKRAQVSRSPSPSPYVRPW